jgi:hypothetical protein
LDAAIPKVRKETIMKTRFAPRFFAVVVLTLLLAAAAAPAAWAAPGLASGAHAPSWGLRPLVEWVQTFLGGWLGWGGEERGLESVTDRSGPAAEPDGDHLFAASLPTDPIRTLEAGELK